MTANAGETAIEAISANVVDTWFENFDKVTVETAKNRIIDTVGCLIGGANDPGNPELVNLVKEYGGKAEATILFHGGQVPAGNAAMLNSIMARSFDFEPVSPLVEGRGTPGHISGTTVMTAITMGEVQDITGKELLTALLVGDDIRKGIGRNDTQGNIVDQHIVNAVSGFYGDVKLRAVRKGSDDHGILRTRSDIDDIPPLTSDHRNDRRNHKTGRKGNWTVHRSESQRVSIFPSHWCTDPFNEGIAGIRNRIHRRGRIAGFDYFGIGRIERAAHVKLAVGPGNKGYLMVIV